LQLFLKGEPEIVLRTNLGLDLIIAKNLKFVFFSVGLLLVVSPVQVSLEIGILDVGLVDLILLLDAVPFEMEDEGSQHPI
jgi:hypothetical protein